MTSSLFGIFIAVIAMALAFAIIHRFVGNMLADMKRQIEVERVAHRDQINAERADHREEIKRVTDQNTSNLERIEILLGDITALEKALSFADATLKMAGFQEWIQSQHKEKLDKAEEEEAKRKAGGSHGKR